MPHNTIASVTAGCPQVTLASGSAAIGSLAAGTAAIGSLTAGTAIIGKVSIDQTTDGTTNLVAAKGTGTAGTANAGVMTVQGVAAMVPLTVADQTANITVSVTLTVGASYATGDHVGTSSTPITFANAVRTSGGSATLRSITISDPAASTATALELWLFNATVTPPADSAAWDLSDANGLKCVGVVSIPTTAQFLSSATGVMHIGNLGLQFHCAATSLFGALVTRGSPTYTGTLQVMLEIEYDQ